MNDPYPPIADALLKYQSERLNDLVNEMVKCCEDRKFFETQRFSLSHAELRCLMLFAGERYLTVKGIAQRLDVTKSRVTSIIDQLSEKQLVERRDDPRDARVKLINLTSAGLKKAREVEMFKMGIHHRILLQMTPEDRKEALSFLEKLRSAMEAVKKQFT